MLFVGLGATSAMHLSYNGSFDLGTYGNATLTYRGAKKTCQGATCAVMITKKDANTIWGFFMGSNQTLGLFRGYFCVPLPRK